MSQDKLKTDLKRILAVIGRSLISFLHNAGRNNLGCHKQYDKSPLKTVYQEPARHKNGYKKQ